LTVWRSQHLTCINSDDQRCERFSCKAFSADLASTRISFIIASLDSVVVASANVKEKRGALFGGPLNIDPGVIASIDSASGIATSTRIFCWRIDASTEQQVLVRRWSSPRDDC
jgi:hypothetical protein